MTQNQNQFVITLSDEQLAKLAKLLETRQGKTMDEELADCLRHGIDNRLYRTERNKRVYMDRKLMETELNLLKKELTELKAVEDKNRIIIAR
jgi:RNA polymerase-interacting CarD/CdnL/TRCF family regulator